MTNPDRTLFSTKRFIGRKYSEVQSEIKMVPFKVCKNDNGDAVFEIEGKIVTPEDAAAQVLMKMKETEGKTLALDIQKRLKIIEENIAAVEQAAFKLNQGEVAGPIETEHGFYLVKAYKVQVFGVYDAGNGIPCLTVFEIKSKAVPLRINACIHVNPDGYPWFQLKLLT